MKIYLAFFCFLCSCELIVIGTPPYEVPSLIPSQTNSLGAGLIFKAELDTNNVSEAAQYLDSNSKLTAFNRYEDYYWDLEILKNHIKGRKITLVSSDTINENQINQEIELDYIKWLKIKTFKKDSLWYISEYSTD